MNKKMVLGLAALGVILVVLYVVKNRKHAPRAQQSSTKHIGAKPSKKSQPPRQARLKPLPELDPNPHPDSYEGKVRAELESISQHIQKDLATRPVQGL